MGCCSLSSANPEGNVTRPNDQKKNTENAPLLSQNQNTPPSESSEKKEYELINHEGISPPEISQVSEITKQSPKTHTLQVTREAPKHKSQPEKMTEHQRTVTSILNENPVTMDDLKPYVPSDNPEEVERDGTLPIINQYDPSNEEPNEIMTEDGLKRNDIPHATVPINETMSKLFLTRLEYEKYRNELVDKAKTKEYIDNVIFDVQKWIIVSSNPQSIDAVTHMLDIVAVRLPVIKLWNQNSWDDYKMLMDRKSIQCPGIWDVMGSRTFFTNFVSIDENNEEILEKLIYISNENDEFLKENPFMKWEQNTEEYKTFYDKLQRIRPQQTFEIIILGDKESVERLILDIRQSEIADPSMSAYIKKEINPLDPEVIFNNETRDETDTIVEIYKCVLENIPKHTKDTDFIRHLRDKREIHVHTCTYFQDKDKVVCADLHLASKKDMEKLKKLVESKSGFIWRKRLISIKRVDTEKKRRKIRRVTSGAKLL